MTMPDPDALRARPVTRLRGGRFQSIPDTLVAEEPLEVRVGNEQFTVTMRTPGADFDLVRGLLLTEGLIESGTDIGRLRYCDTDDPGVSDSNIIIVHLARAPLSTRRWQRTLLASSSCGLCGQAAIDALRLEVAPVPDTHALPADVLLSLPALLREHQPLFAQTGGLHAVGLFSAGGECLCVFEDIGRHNATDKAIGFGVAQGWLPWNRAHAPLILLVSGRASFEITQKALVARIPIVCAVSAASTLAADLADANNQTLIGFLRDANMTIYTHPERIMGAASPNASAP